MPTAIFSFLPLLILDIHWIDPVYTAWFLILFPLSFTYLIASERLYDLAIIVRRLGLTTALSIIPAGFIAGSMGIVFSMEYKVESIFIIFVFTLIVLSLLLYSLEYLLTKLEPILFPRKYYLQSSLKKIANSLSSTSNFHDLKANILVDIVRTLEVFGGALVFKYKDGIESFTEGAIDVAEVESLIASEQLEHAGYTFYVVCRNEEYTSYLVMTQKKTNTLLGLEDTQWLNLIISYLAVSLENVHLIRNMTIIASHRDLLHRVTMNTINDGVIITDNKGSIVELNQLIEKIIDCRKEHVINESVFQFEALAGYMKSVLHNEQRFENVECSFKPSVGKQVNCLLDAFPILNDQEEIIGAYLRIWDISERIEHEKQMLSAEKFSLMGKLAVGIAHEIRNPLTSIMGIVQLLREKYVSSETYYRFMNIMHDELNNLKTSVTDFVHMAKPSVPEKKEVIIQHIINETVQLMTSQANINGILLTTNLTSAEIKLCVDAVQMKQVFMNLLQNAFEATQKGGEVNIGLICNPENNDVEISIKDTGIGITQSQLNEVFNPFFTTKENGIGIGLGICSRIIENHNGRISVASSQGTGTVFTIVFPSGVL
jgi:two-component system, sporulation sensor kinase E